MTWLSDLKSSTTQIWFKVASKCVYNIYQLKQMHTRLKVQSVVTAFRWMILSCLHFVTEKPERDGLL